MAAACGARARLSAAGGRDARLGLGRLGAARLPGTYRTRGVTAKGQRALSVAREAPEKRGLRGRRGPTCVSGVRRPRSCVTECAKCLQYPGMNTRIAVSLCVCSLAVGGVAQGCRGGSGPGFGSSDGTGAGRDDGDAASDGGPGASNDTPVASGDDAGPTGVFTSSDASGLPSGVVFDCKPGTYSGMFATMVTSDAGGIFSLLSFNWTGSLSITLQGMVMSGSGEIPEPTLTIAPGAKLSGTDAYGGNFTADLGGQLDCPTKVFTATISNGAYTYSGTTVMMAGTLSGIYDGTMMPPALTMGAMNVSSPQITSLGSAGTWTATLQ